MRAAHYVAAIFQLAARRLWANRRLAAGLLVGFTVAVAAAASIPGFANSALQRVLQAELNAAPGRQPAGIIIAHDENPRRRTTPAQYEAADRLLQAEGARMLSLPVSPTVRYAALDKTLAEPVDPARVDPRVQRWVSLAFLSDLRDHVILVDGRFPEGGGYEAVVEEGALEKLDFTVGMAFWVPVGTGTSAPRVKVTVVGAFRRVDPSDPYWFQGDSYDSQLFVPEEVWREQLLTAPLATPGSYAWYFGMEAGEIRMTDAVRLLGALYSLEARAGGALPDTRIVAGPLDLLTRYALRAQELQRLLLLLAVAPLAMVAYFLVVTMGMLVDGQRQEIAMLRSRGAGLWQIAGFYLAEGAVLALLALAGGYPLALLQIRIMGAVAGFLQFVSRVQPPFLLSADFWLFGLAAALLAVLAYLLPAMGAARQSIIGYKQESARRQGRPFWMRWGLDLVIIGLAVYVTYTMRQSADSLEPLELLAPVLFVAGAGLLCLRFLPPLLRAAARLADRRAGAPLYLTLIQLSRAPGSYTPVVLLLTLTTGFGIYSAVAARTLERSVADRIFYMGGADAVIEESWGAVPRADGSLNADGTPAVDLIAPPWQVHYELPGVIHPARVRVQPVTPAISDRSTRKGNLMAIDPMDFGKVAWFRRDLAPAHLNAYLNLLGRDEEAVLVSTGFLTRNHLQPGDRITLAAETGQEVSLVIYGALSYWPGLDPAEADFFVAHLDYVETALGLQPHQVWLRMEEGAGIQPTIDALKAQGIAAVRATDHRQQLIRARRDPMLAGLLGGLTSGFLLGALVTVLGFWLFAALSVRSRQLQFGVLRALGLGRGELTGAVVLEQVLAAGAGVALGTGLGLAAAWLYVPFLQQGGRTPPFLLVAPPADRLRLYAVLLLMLLVGAAGLAAALGRLRIHEAVKLGEDH